MSDNKIELGKIFNDGYGIIPRKIMRDKELNIYEKCILAYFLSFTGAGKDSCWPSLNTISKELCISKTTVIKHLKKLEEKEFIQKSSLTEEGQSVNKYTLFFDSVSGKKFKITKVEPNNHNGSTGDVPGGTGDVLGVVQQVNPNINNININNNINQSSLYDDKKSGLEKKIAYRDNIKLTEKENDKLLNEYGIDNVNRLFDYLSAYKIEKGYKTKSDYLTIKRWVVKVKDLVKPLNINNNITYHDHDYQEIV